MGRTMRRSAALPALWRALRSGARGGPTVSQRLAALPRMIKMTARGEYDGGLRLAMMAAATAYVVSPIDAVPEAALLIFGLADDALLVTWLAGAVLDETGRFLEWEARRRAVIPGDVVR